MVGGVRCGGQTRDVIKIGSENIGHVEGLIKWLRQTITVREGELMKMSKSAQSTRK
jgi:hypothetical protein